MSKRNYDFAGWVTKNDIVCADGVTIKHDAFRDNDGQQVPLVWNHDYNSPSNVLGHVTLENRETGVYGYGYFNETHDAQNAKQLVKHGDISSMSIGARKIKRQGTDVVHGMIYEVSLVMSAANPGAMIDSVVNHSEGGEEKGIIITGNLIHSHDDIIEHNEEGGTQVADEDKTIGDVIEGMSDDQQEAVYALLGMVSDSKLEDKSDEKDEDIQQSADKKDEKDQKDQKDDKGDDDLKHNVFNQQQSNKEETLKHNFNDALQHAINQKAGSLKDVLASHEIKHKNEAGEEVITHGINSIEMLFPEADHSTNGNTPILYKDPNTSYKRILNGVSKSPFSKVRTLVADLTEDEARAKGYIKGNMKKEEFFSLIKRKTGPTTVYKKQKLDRDDIIDITDFDVVSFMNREMRMMLEEEVARAILVGDGRDVADEDKIDETNIRPVINDNDFFTIKKSYANASAFIEAVILAMSEYRGSGRPDMFIDPALIASVRLLKGTDGRYLFGDIPSNAAIAAKLGLGEIIETTFMVGNGALVVNLNDYQLGASKGGEITNFDDFDIDFNQYKYLTETRLSGALTMPKSAIHFAEGTAATGADDETAGMSYGTRQADKTTTTTTTA